LCIIKQATGNRQQATVAIMLLVHNNEEQVNRLIRHLASDFDIYVHIDKRCSVKINKLENVYVYKKYKTYWGSFNLVMATLCLLKKAFFNGYKRYLLISGQDLPIKTNESIRDFFENNDKNYVNMIKIPRSDGWPDNMRGLTGYHINNFWRGRKNNKLGKLLIKIIKKLLYYLSMIKPRKINYDFYGGSQWVNYTHDCVNKIFEFLKNDKNYIMRYRWTSCSDEIFFQTIINGLCGLTIENANLRYADWTSGPEFPRTLRVEDYEKIIRTDSLFARKFDSNIDKEIIELIYKKIENM